MTVVTGCTEKTISNQFTVRQAREKLNILMVADSDQVLIFSPYPGYCPGSCPALGTVLRSNAVILLKARMVCRRADGCIYLQVDCVWGRVCTNP